MRYMMLIFNDPAFTPTQDGYQEYTAFTEDVMQKGMMSSGEALQGIETATTVRVRNGNVATTDGPYSETKEVLGGFYVLDCTDLDEAIAYAAKIPSVRRGAVEIRPVVPF